MVTLLNLVNCIDHGMEQNEFMHVEGKYLAREEWDFEFFGRNSEKCCCSYFLDIVGEISWKLHFEVFDNSHQPKARF